MKYFDNFLEDLKNKRYSKNTQEDYYYTLIKFKKYLDLIKIDDEKLITEKNIIDYLEYLKQNKVSNRIYYRSIIYLKRYFKYLETENIIFISPIKNFINPKDERNYTPVLTVKEVKEVIEKIDTKKYNDLKTKTILELLYSSALRPREVIDLKLTHIDFSKKIIFIEESKNKKDRVVPVGDKAIGLIQKYLEIRNNILKNKNIDNKYVFVNRDGAKLNYRSLYSSVKRTFEKYGITPFRLYSMRSSSATHLLNNGMPILHIQKLLGHEEVKTTQVYLRLKILDLQKELSKKHPRNKI